jgi:hypothetical protein
MTGSRCRCPGSRCPGSWAAPGDGNCRVTVQCGGRPPSAHTRRSPYQAMRLRACLWTARQRPVGQPAGRKRPALRVTFLRAACDSVSSTESDLRQWLRDQGGWVHPSLRLVDAAPCGARGVVAAATIQLTDLEQGPLVSIPQGLQFSSVYAQRLLVSLATHTSPPQLPLAAEPAATPAAAPGLQQALQQAIQPLSAAQLVAAALVHEVQQGSSSAWHPYLASLPQQPPSPWLMAPADLAATLDQLGPQAAGWTHAAAAARSEQQEAARGIRQQLYSLCTACQDEDALLWALGQVRPRLDHTPPTWTPGGAGTAASSHCPPGIARVTWSTAVLAPAGGLPCADPGCWGVWSGAVHRPAEPQRSCPATHAAAG